MQKTAVFGLFFAILEQVKGIEPVISKKIVSKTLTILAHCDKTATT